MYMSTSEEAKLHYNYTYVYVLYSKVNTMLAFAHDKGTTDWLYTLTLSKG